MKVKLLLVGVVFLVLFWFSACKEIEDPAPEIKSKWEVFTTKDGLSSNIVWALEEYPSGTIWAGTQRGLSKLKGDNFSLWKYSDLVVKSLRSSDKGLLAATNMGSYIIDENLVNIFKAYKFSMLDVLSDGTHYWGVVVGQLIWIDDDYLSPDLVPTVYVNGLYFDGKYIWVSTQSMGLYKLYYQSPSDISSLKLGEIYFKSNGPSSNACYTLFKDSKSRIWVGVGSEMGLCQIQEDNQIMSFSFPYIKSIAEDHNGDLWLGSDSSGLYKWETNGNIINYTMLDGLPSNRITKVMVASDGSVWVATEDAGIAMLKE